MRTSFDESQTFKDLKRDLINIAMYLLISGGIGFVFLVILRLIFCPKKTLILPTTKECILVGFPIFWFYGLIFCGTGRELHQLKRTENPIYSSLGGDDFYDYELDRNGRVLMNWQFPEPLKVSWANCEETRGLPEPTLVKNGGSWFVRGDLSKAGYLNFYFGENAWPATIKGGVPNSTASYVVFHLVNVLLVLYFLTYSILSTVRAMTDPRTTSFIPESQT